MKARARLASVVRSLGYTLTRSRISPCPACGVERRADERRGAVGIVRGEGWSCNACGAEGDVVDFVREAIKATRLSEVREWFENRGDIGQLDAVEGSSPIPPPERVYPPEGEIRRLFKAATPLARAEGTPAARFCLARGIPLSAPLYVAPSPSSFDYRGLSTRFRSKSGRLVVWWPDVWANEYPILAPMFTVDGRLAGVHGRRIGGEGRKTTNALGYSVGGLLFANAVGLAVLRGTSASPPRAALFAEGVTDHASASARAASLAVFGVVSGSAEALSGLRLDPSTVAIAATDPDAAGDVYARKIANALAPHPVRRAPLADLARR